MSTLSGPGASTAVTTVRAPWLQDPLPPERTGSAPGPAEAAHWLTSSTSLVTSLSPSSPLINGTGTAGLALTDRPADPQHPRGRYQWPTGAPATVVEDFDPPAVVWGRGHRGVDLAAAEGTQIRSAAAGTVAFSGMVAGRPVVSIDHSDGIRTTYEPVEPAVSAGDTVAAGQAIGTLLPGHRSDGVCALHWGARTGPKTYINPLRLLQPAVIRLKPPH
ncbi:M23 family metallopeptidase [Actinomyces sp.]|uniref:M23 family metallopeptidase n=1 Tax=Actinomyces sp. TaxID=29317 RepID=UPI0026DAB9F3|nr:M23 family metallopeptidase [Actinomyces sp.]MDO4655993.1 M23 family metallopeptidase [Actinomyces sp.]